MRVLLVEDDVRVAAALENSLRRRGYETLHVATAAQALAAPPVDLVLLDLGLPDEVWQTTWAGNLHTVDGHRAFVEPGRGRRVVGAGFAAVAIGLARWILRPVDELDGAVHRIGAGRRSGPRCPSHSGRQSCDDSPDPSTTWRPTSPTCWGGSASSSRWPATRCATR